MNHKRNLAILVVLIVGLVVSASIMTIAGMSTEGKKVTVKGEVLDLACYIGHEGKGMKHQQCALTCLKDGQPMGLLTDDGVVYLLLADHQDGKPFNETKNYAALQVEISGTMFERAGIKAVSVESVKKL